MRKPISLLCGLALAVIALAGAASGSVKGPGEGEELLRYWSWSRHEGSRRNPFVYRALGEPHMDDDEGDAPPPPVPPRPRVDLSGIARRGAQDARSHLDKCQLDRAERTAEEVLERIQGADGLDPADVERLRRLALTARRLRLRRETERAFADLPIDIRGIVWDGRDAVALVNGTTVRRGDVIQGARIEEIRRDGIVFVLNGIRVRKGCRR